MALAVLTLRDPLFAASQVLGLKVHTTLPCFYFFNLYFTSKVFKLSMCVHIYPRMRYGVDVQVMGQPQL